MRAAQLSTYLITDQELCGARGVLPVIASALAGGVTTVQIRSKSAPTRELYQLLVAASELTAGRALLLIDDRVDVFLAARADGAIVDGVHVGQSDLPARRVRELIGPGAVLGLTASTPAQITAADTLPPGTVDYLGVGVIRPTDTKPDHPAALGTSGFARLAASTLLPCVAIGGIRLSDSASLRAAGAAGVAVVSAICAADDPEDSTRAFAEAWAAAA